MKLSRTGMEASRPSERAGVLGRGKGTLAPRAGLRPPWPRPARPGDSHAWARGRRSLRRGLRAPERSPTRAWDERPGFHVRSAGRYRRSRLECDEILGYQLGIPGAQPALGEGDVFDGNTERGELLGGDLPVPDAAPELP
jgi:hypothetical protein